MHSVPVQPKCGPVKSMVGWGCTSGPQAAEPEIQPHGPILEISPRAAVPSPFRPARPSSTSFLAPVRRPIPYVGERASATGRLPGRPANNASSRRRSRVGGARGRHRPPESSRIVWWHVHDPVIQLQSIHAKLTTFGTDWRARAAGDHPGRSAGSHGRPWSSSIERVLAQVSLAAGHYYRVGLAKH